MKSITMSKRIEAPVERVFELCSDFASAADRVSGIERVEMLTDGPVGVGTKFRETRVFMKREATEEMEVTAFDPPRGYTLEAESCGAHYTTEFRFVPDGSGTKVEMEFKAQPVTFFARLMTPVSKMMAGTIRKCIERDLDDIKEAAEGRVGATAPA